MKSFIFALVLVSSASSFADFRQEFDEETEKKCHHEARKKGCVKNDLEDKNCTEKIKKDLSDTCKNLHEERKKVR